MDPSAEVGLVIGDGAALPFRARSFDVVVTADTLEHVPSLRRRAFLAECTRFAARAVVVAGPFAHPRVDEAEEILQSFLRHKLQLEHRYLEEHRTHGLPDQTEAEAILRANGANDATSIGHGSLERWLLLICLSCTSITTPTSGGSLRA